MAQLNPYLKFSGNCREAMTFYHEVLGGELSLQTVGETPMKDQMPAETHNEILHSVLQGNGFVIMASDMLRVDQIKDGNRVTLVLNCESEEEINTLFSKLADGGNIEHPLKTEFWGATYGDLTDKFGINWMFNYQKSQA